MIKIVVTTMPDSASAQELAKKLVESAAAACVNILPGVTSVYFWEGKLESTSEVLLIIKTSSSGAQPLLQQLKAFHPYQVPEILVLSPEQVSESYGKWVEQSVRAG